MSRFEQAAKILMGQLEDTHDIETIQQFLVTFAEHILWHTTPASGSSILKYKDLLISEIAERVPDMEEVIE